MNPLTRLFLLTALGWILIILALNLPVPPVFQLVILFIGLGVSIYALLLIIKQLRTK
ncbi:hypothetical protein GCM10007425_29800 [Lysinibacillus alkalisoli]|uniref:Uncharacterized protein n=1 Tax=Lysinibacillus alkalisoli TaxID=1911548 RepID=A0A917LJT8_9BACI|nr:hypothetical protein [Lysinibacillus alkalisoli]GGG33149.1 hypothetical protein GCM10007425_29800 [Lysinibacillus alkalisoli]